MALSTSKIPPNPSQTGVPILLSTQYGSRGKQVSFGSVTTKDLPVDDTKKLKVSLEEPPEDGLLRVQQFIGFLIKSAIGALSVLSLASLGEKKTVQTFGEDPHLKESLTSVDAVKSLREIGALYTSKDGAEVVHLRKAAYTRENGEEQVCFVVMNPKGEVPLLRTEGLPPDEVHLQVLIPGGGAIETISVTGPSAELMREASNRLHTGNITASEAAYLCCRGGLELQTQIPTKDEHGRPRFVPKHPSLRLYPETYAVRPPQGGDEHKVLGLGPKVHDEGVFWHEPEAFIRSVLTGVEALLEKAGWKVNLANPYLSSEHPFSSTHYIQHPTRVAWSSA
jgi:hypothetical protein